MWVLAQCIELAFRAVVAVGRLVRGDKHASPDHRLHDIVEADVLPVQASYTRVKRHGGAKAPVRAGADQLPDQ